MFNLQPFDCLENLFYVMSRSYRGINPEARGWAFNNETGGPWDAVQMGFNGMRVFARLGISL
jgi:hypothetical protein